MKIKSSKLVVSFLGLSAVLVSGLAMAAGQTYRITVKNVTAANALSPFVAVVHTPDYKLFELGSAATAGISQIAETGATDMLEAELALQPEVLKLGKVAGGPLMAGEERSLEIELDHVDVMKGASIDIIAMIGMSNDSFIAARSIPLQAATMQFLEKAASNFDAGSEENTGNIADFGPGGHPVDQAEGRISYDRGLNRDGDAPEMIGWGSVAAEVRIELVK